MKKTIGILGGMGPLATSDLFRKILEVTEAHTDQEYPRVIIDSNTEIPDRTAAILHGGMDPVPQMVQSAVKLESMGADVLVMPCNTAHYFYEQVSRFVTIPIVHMLKETAAYVKQSGIKRVGLLATDGTIESGVYKRAFEAETVEMLVPSHRTQQAVMDLIYKGIKSDNYSIDTEPFQRTMQELLEKGAGTLILGCTELPIAFEHFAFQVPQIDPTRILAVRAVEYLGYPVKGEYR